MKNRLNLNSILYFIFIAIMFMMMGLQPSSAAETASSAVSDGLSLGTWLVISLGLAAFGFKTRSKS